LEESGEEGCEESGERGSQAEEIGIVRRVELIRAGRGIRKYRVGRDYTRVQFRGAELHPLAAQEVGFREVVETLRLVFGVFKM
jgi:hypothetical protein